MKSLRSRPGYTLLELLVSIAIFSGVMVMALGAFARSANSAAKSNVTREKSELTRSIIDQISNDFRYVAIDQTTGLGCPSQGPGLVWHGFCTDALSGANSSVHLLIDYPNQDTFVGKTYYTVGGGDNLKLRVTETRGCTTAAACAPTIANPKELLPSNYTLDDPLGKIFTAKADNTNPGLIAIGYLKLEIALKPKGGDCTKLGSCYKLSTTLVPGGF